MAKIKLPKAPTVASVPQRRFSTEFEYLIIENAFGYYGTHVIKIEDAGLVCVLGRNLQSKEESSSGAGKSRWHALLLYLFFGKTALGSNESIKDADVFGSNFRIETVLRRNGKRLLVRETRNHSNPKFKKGLSVYEITTDKKLVPWDAGPKNDPAMLRRRLQKFLSWTYKEAVGTVIWPQGFGHALVDGKPSERISFLSDLYGLTRYDEIYEQLDIMHKELKAKIADLSEFKAEYRIVEDEMSKFGDIKQIRERAISLRDKIADFKPKIETQRKRLSLFDSKLTHFNRLREQLDGFHKFELDARELHHIVDGSLLSEFDIACDQVKTKLEKYEDAAEGINALADARQRLKEASGAQITAGGLDKLRDRLGALKNAINDCGRPEYTAEQAAQMAEAVKALKQSVMDACRRLNVKPNRGELMQLFTFADRRSKELDASMRTLDSQLVELRELEQTFGVEANCKCPTCRQAVDVERLRKMMKSLEVQIAKIDGDLAPIEARADDLKKLIEQLAQYQELSHGAAQAAEDAANLEKLNKLEDEHKKIYDQIERFERHRVLVAEVQRLETKFGKFEHEKIEKAIEHYRKLIAANDKQRQIYYEVVSASAAIQSTALSLSLDDPFTADVAHELKHLQQEREKVASWLADAERKLEDAQRRFTQYSQIIRDYRERSSHLDSLKQQMEELKKLEEREYVIANTKPAYAKNGLKMDQLQKLLKALAERLPYWTRILFTEKDFKVEVKGDENCSSLSLVVPKTFEVGKRKIVRKIDISALSGGERSRMAVCLMLTMADLVSTDKRANFMVLDEVDRHLDTFGQRLMADLLIPLMRERKSGLFVISHSTFIDPKKFDQTMVVTKHENNLTDIKFVKQGRM